MMNRKQLVCLWLGIAAFCLLALFPPWYAKTGDGPVRLWHASFYHAPEVFPWARIDGERLILEWSVVVALTFGLVVSFGRKHASN